jgi:hypothetical protein
MVYYNNRYLADTICGNSDHEVSVKIKNPILWSPDNPFLYDITIELKNGNKTIDKVTSYTGIRKISIGKTADGFTRMLLNNEFVWQNGPLDQGFWPEGIYTPPTEKAMVFDLMMTKKMGFNMLRKHINVFKANHNIIPPTLVSPFRIFTDNYVAELRNNRLGGKFSILPMAVNRTRILSNIPHLLDCQRLVQLKLSLNGKMRRAG